MWKSNVWWLQSKYLQILHYKVTVHMNMKFLTLRESHADWNSAPVHFWWHLYPYACCRAGHLATFPSVEGLSTVVVSVTLTTAGKKQGPCAEFLSMRDRACYDWWSLSPHAIVYVLSSGVWVRMRASMWLHFQNPTSRHPKKKCILFNLFEVQQVIIIFSII